FNTNDASASLRLVPWSSNARQRGLKTNASLCAHLLHRIYIGRRKLFQRTRAKGGGGEKGGGSASDRSLLLLCTNVIRVATINDGRPQYGNRSGFSGMQNGRIKASRL